MSEGDFLARLLRPADGARAALGMVGAPPLSYAELADRVGVVAARLADNGFRPGQRMLFAIRPCVDAVLLVLGTMAAGGTIVFVDPGAGPELFARRLALVAPDWAATESLLFLVSGPLHRLGRARGLALPRFADLDVRHIHSGPQLPGTPRRSLPIARLFAGGGAEPAPRGADAEALIVFTSGTTSEPKAVVHTRGSLSAGLAAVAGRSTLGPDAHLHTEQLMMGLPALMAGARWSMPRYPLLGSHIEPLRFARGLDAATHAFFTPADLAVVLDAIESGRLRPPSGLREISLGGAPVTTALLRRARAALPRCRLLAIYGMTEILPVAITSGDAKLAYQGEGDPLGAVVPGVRARVADDGELILSGPNLCRGYLGEPPLAEIHTGDLARLTDDGIVLIGRKKDMLIRGKTNIYPGLYEPAIAAIAGVRQAVMIGIPDEVGDERVVLAVVPDPADPDVPGLTGRLRRELPRIIDTAALPDDIVLVETIPTTGRTSKPNRSALRAQLQSTVRLGQP